VVAAHADLYLRPPGSAAFAPDLLVLVGGLSTSKAVTTWAAGSGATAVALWPDGRGRDADALADLVAVGDVADAATRLAGLVTATADPAWAARGRAAEAHASAAIGAGDPAPSPEARAVRAAIAALPAGALLALSNSLPIRHADAYMGLGPAGVRPVVYRGASGIDGVTAASLGAARGAGAPTLLVTGDLAFLHDLGGLAAARAVDVPVAILVLDNDGGGIFHHLPIAEAAPDFEALFGTPQGRELARAAALFGLPCEVVGSVAAVGTAVAAALGRPGVSVVVFPSDRTETAAAHKAFVAACAREVARG
jgi:2-succinyl-5-enolpyruvyl-6-hydroxy-3-cyclohexene-1-carboxylate synthase